MTPAWLSPTGPRCHLPCPEGFWGANCSNTCTCKNGGTCVPENGNCVCAPGFRGPSCQRREAHYTPAPPVSSSDLGAPLRPVGWPDSHLQGSYSSGKGAGRHWSRAPPSYHASLSSACPPGRYGKRCVPCKCNNHSSCHPSDGTCSCLAGWTGSDCSESMYQLVCGSAPAAWVTALWLLSGPGQRASLPQLSVT